MLWALVPLRWWLSEVVVVGLRSGRRSWRSETIGVPVASASLTSASLASSSSTSASLTSASLTSASLAPAWLASASLTPASLASRSGWARAYRGGRGLWKDPGRALKFFGGPVVRGCAAGGNLPATGLWRRVGGVSWLRVSDVGGEMTGALRLLCRALRWLSSRGPRLRTQRLENVASDKRSRSV